MNTQDIQQDVLADGFIRFRWDAHESLAAPVSKDLFVKPPAWLKSMLKREASLTEVISVLGTRVQQVRTSRERRTLVDVAEKLGSTHDGRRVLEAILGAQFIEWLRLGGLPTLAWSPSMILYANPDLAPPSAWLAPWNDETVWPETALLARNLSQDISAVWQNNVPAFLELFLFDGPDLHGKMTRIARVATPNSPLPVILDDPSLDNESRSLLAWSFGGGGRRFLASDVLRATAEQVFNNSANASPSWGTVTLLQPPQFFWDGYSNYLSTLNPTEKIALLEVRFSFQIDDVLFGTTTASMTVGSLFRRSGGMQSISASSCRARVFIPQPWAGGMNPPAIRWSQSNVIVGLLGVCSAFAQRLSQLAGPASGNIRVAPGRSRVIPPQNGHWGLIEIGNTGDDATVVFLP